jgi:3-deoxy-D-arabino-heptulosonate 7-phosphate (DAHP) synthase
MDKQRFTSRLVDRTQPLYCDSVYEYFIQASSRKYKEQDSIVLVKDILIGGYSIIFLAWPYTVEDRTTMMDTAFAVRQS